MLSKVAGAAWRACPAAAAPGWPRPPPCTAASSCRMAACCPGLPWRPSSSRVRSAPPRRSTQPASRGCRMRAGAGAAAAGSPSCSPAPSSCSRSASSLSASICALISAARAARAAASDRCPAAGGAGLRGWQWWRQRWRQRRRRRLLLVLARHPLLLLGGAGRRRLPRQVVLWQRRRRRRRQRGALEQQQARSVGIRCWLLQLVDAGGCLRVSKDAAAAGQARVHRAPWEGSGHPSLRRREASAPGSAAGVRCRRQAAAAPARLGQHRPLLAHGCWHQRGPWAASSQTAPPAR